MLVCGLGVTILLIVIIEAVGLGGIGSVSGY